MSPWITGWSYMANLWDGDSYDIVRFWHGIHYYFWEDTRWWGIVVLYLMLVCTNLRTPYNLKFSLHDMYITYNGIHIVKCILKSLTFSSDAIEVCIFQTMQCSGLEVDLISALIVWNQTKQLVWTIGKQSQTFWKDLGFVYLGAWFGQPNSKG